MRITIYQKTIDHDLCVDIKGENLTADDTLLLWYIARALRDFMKAQQEATPSDDHQ